MANETSKIQDKLLMDAIGEFLCATAGVQIAMPSVTGVARNHDRSLTVAFKDGRVVTLVLYGPRGKYGN